MAPIPVPIGKLKAGEKLTAEIRGRLGEVKESFKGELIIGIILSEGLPPGTHSILAEIQPGSPSKVFPVNSFSLEGFSTIHFF